MQEQSIALDPSSSADVEALRGMFRQRRQAFGPELRDLAGRARTFSPDPLLRLDALNVLASAAVTDGDDDGASGLFRQVLDATWGSDTHAERVACVNLAMIVTRQRRLVEAFALCRRACAIALASSDDLAICLSHAQLAKTLLELGDHEGFRRAVDVAERHRPAIDATLRGWVPHLLAGLHAEVALQAGNEAEAEEHVRAALDRPEVPADVVRMARAQHLRRIGRPAQALGVVREALAEGSTEPHYPLRFEAEELLCLVDLGDEATLRERAAGCLDRMTREGRDCGSATWRMRVGETVGTALSRLDGMHSEALRAFELAAVAALERSWESKLFFQEFPQLEKMTADDVAVLEAHGERFRAKHFELLAAIGRLLREGARFEATLSDAEAEALFVAICAWCRSVRGPDRTWIPLGELVVQSGDLAVTHGICGPCTAGLRSAAPAREGSAVA